MNGDGDLISQSKGLQRPVTIPYYWEIGGKVLQASHFSLSPSLPT